MPDLRGVRVGLFGQFDPAYARSRVLKRALELAGADVVVMSVRGRYVRRTPKLLATGLRSRIDVLVVMFPSRIDVATARLLSLRLRVPVVFDPLVSMLETDEDRQGAALRRLPARRAWCEDWLALRLPHVVLADTATHADFYARTFGVPRGRLRVVSLGTDDEVMRPEAARPHDDAIRVFFYGGFTPLHGLEHIVRAAHLLEREGSGICFDIVGNGVLSREIIQLARDLDVPSLRFLGRRSYEELPRHFADSDICLGVFGTSNKTARVVPNKVVDALATARPVITADTSAIREVLVHRESGCLVPAGDPEALAGAVLALARDPLMRDRLGSAGHRVFVERFSTAAVSAQLTDAVLAVCN